LISPFWGHFSGGFVSSLDSNGASVGNFLYSSTLSTQVISLSNSAICLTLAWVCPTNINTEVNTNPALPGSISKTFISLN
jgi:hypothetical protein